MMTPEEFAELPIGDMKRELIDLLNGVPDESMEELYHQVKDILEQEKNT